MEALLKFRFNTIKGVLLKTPIKISMDSVHLKVQMQLTQDNSVINGGHNKAGTISVLFPTLLLHINFQLDWTENG